MHSVHHDRISPILERTTTPPMGERVTQTSPEWKAATVTEELEASDDDNDVTPKAKRFTSGGTLVVNKGTPKRLILRPDTAPAPGTPSIDPRKRPCSPTKTATNIQFGHIVTRVFDFGQIPKSPYTNELLKGIQDVVAGVDAVPSTNINPKLVLNTKNTVGDQPHPQNIHLQPQTDAINDLNDILAAATDCINECQSNLAWNIRVHDPLLRLAMEKTTLSRLRVWEATTATIIPELLPRIFITGDLLRSPLVDFCITIEPDTVGKANIEQLLAPKPNALCSINQTSYPPLHSRPIAIPVRFETVDVAVLNKIQLATWTKAWLVRMKALQATNVPPLPLLHIEGHDWFLLLTWEEYTQAQEDGEHKEQHRAEPTHVIMHKLPIGGTGSPVDIYRLFKVLRLLATWADGPFREWHGGVIARVSRARPCYIDK